MQTFNWSQCFETGITSVDSEHKELVSIINRFGDLLAENTIRFEDIQSTLQELIEYTVHHFTNEEKLMQDVGLDERHVKQHMSAHRHFINQINEMTAVLTKDTAGSSRHLLDMLTHWLAYHILGVDQVMSKQIVAIGKGTAPKDAYEQYCEQTDSTTEPLLAALNGLFEVVSARNSELVKLNQSLEERIAERTKELEESNRKLTQLSQTDALTGLPNRRHAMMRMKQIWDDAIEQNQNLVTIMIDADHFKEVNDTYGHDAGDDVLITLAKELRNSFRNDDLIFRLGGDEFFAICPYTDLEGGMNIAELTRQRIAQLKVPAGKGFWHGSISMGVAALESDMLDYGELLKKADLSVYEAKRHGKNCVRTIQKLNCKSAQSPEAALEINSTA